MRHEGSRLAKIEAFVQRNRKKFAIGVGGLTLTSAVLGAGLGLASAESDDKPNDVPSDVATQPADTSTSTSSTTVPELSGGTEATFEVPTTTTSTTSTTIPETTTTAAPTTTEQAPTTTQPEAEPDTLRVGEFQCYDNGPMYIIDFYPNESDPTGGDTYTTDPSDGYRWHHSELGMSTFVPNNPSDSAQDYTGRVFDIVCAEGD